MTDRKNCPDCGAASIDSRSESQPIHYRPAPDTVLIPCTVIVWRCSACTLEWTDHEAEDARTKAVNEYLAKTP